MLEKKQTITLLRTVINLLSRVKTNRDSMTAMKAEVGLVGALLFAFGGAILLGLLYNVGIAQIGFFGFLFIGLGLWIIVLSGKAETKQNPS